MSSTFFIPAVNIMGIDCLDEAMTAIVGYGFAKALIVTDTGVETPSRFQSTHPFDARVIS